jgi:hypothetical protein
MVTDSLFKRRVEVLYKQPDTVRGRCIVWYAETEQQKTYGKEIVAFVLTIIVMAHLVIFSLLL